MNTMLGTTMITPLIRSAGGIDKDRPFPFVLYSMLENAEQGGYSHIVSWVPGTDCYFKVHDPQEFTKTVMKEYFAQTLYKSFQRQLNLYCFKRNTEVGPFRGAYSHMLFVRGKSELCQFIVRIKDKKKAFLPNFSLSSFSSQNASRGLLLPSISSRQSRDEQSGECNFNNEFAVAAFSGKTITKMTSVPPKHTGHTNVTQDEFEEIMSRLSSNLQEEDDQEPIHVFSMSTRSVLQHESVPLLDNSISSNSPPSLLYEPRPLLMEENVNFTSNIKMMDDVKQDIIDIFGR